MVKATDQEGRTSAPTRRRIVEAAADLIAEAGWNAITTRRIAERAGVNNALIHYYFGSKDDLLLEAANAVFSDEIEGPVARMLAAPTLTEGIGEFVEFLRTVEEHGPAVVITVEALLRGLRDEKVRVWIEEAIGGARQLLELLVVAAQERGELTGDLDPTATAAVLGALLDGLLLYRLTDPELDLAAIERVLQMLFGGMKGTP